MKSALNMHARGIGQLTSPRPSTNAFRCPSTSSRVIRRRAQSEQVPPRAEPGTRRRSKPVEELKDPAKIGAAGKNTVAVNAYAAPGDLSTYMTLPVEQYFVLDPNLIRHLEGSRFIISIPRVDILGAWLEPEVEIDVTTYTNPPRVVLQADGYSLRGSEGIEMMRLDERFALKFTTELTWNCPAITPGFSSGNGGVVPIGKGEIIGNASVDVWSEVIPPFNLMPRDLMQGSCNVVMSGLLNSMLPLFMRLLGEDYEKWARDEQYRAQRAMRRIPLEQPL